MAKLYSLLIGITDYPEPFGLNECVRDVEKVRDYIIGLDQHYYNVIQEPVTLLNDKATKSQIALSLTKILSQLNEDDTLLFYYSGHGAEEIAPGRFLDDHNGLIQGIVCYYDNDGESSPLLADKELRYLFNRSKTKAHIISIFDCCHSGDVTRGIDKEKNIKRLSAKYPERSYEEFLFHNEAEEETFKEKRFNKIFPDIDLITLSACSSTEFSWENNEGGYFTRVLIQSLAINNNLINYGELIRECRILIQNKTLEKQTPAIDILGDKQLNQLTSWLRLNGDQLTSSLGFIKYFESKGWIYSRGSLNGVNEGDSIIINDPEYGAEEIKINEVYLLESKIDDILSLDFELDHNKRYPVILNSSMPKLKLTVENLDGDLETEDTLIKILENDGRLEVSNRLFESDFQINIYNELIFFSKPNDPYRPLNKQLDLLDDNFDEKVKGKRINDYISENLETLNKWHLIKSISLNEGFNEIPIKVEIKYGDNEWVNITNGSVTLEPEGRKYNGLLSCDYEVRVSNISNEDLYITVLSLYNSRLEISIHAFDETTILLNPGNHKKFEPSTIVLDHYQEIYNWEGESVEFKFIVNNHQSLDANIASMAQDGFLEPITHFGTLAGGGQKIKFDKHDKSAIYSSKVHLTNTTVNQISGALLSNIKWYEESELVSPFIQRLYFDIESDFFAYNLTNKPSANEEAYRGSIKMNIGNLIDYTRRNRKFKKMRRQYPNKAVIVAEGDSWFLYPILVKDTIDFIMETWPVKNLAWAGDTLENYKKSGQLLKAVNKLEPKPKYVLISGGGNDIIGQEIKNLLIRNATNIQSPRDYLNDKYDQQMQKLNEYYTYFFDELSKLEWIEKILVHGYDYIRPDHARIVVKSGWLNRYLEEFGITNDGDRDVLIKFLIDEFNKSLEEISKDYPKVKYLNLRGIINRDEWYDEIHPNDQGYRKVANKFLTEIND